MIKKCHASPKIPEEINSYNVERHGKGLTLYASGRWCGEEIVCSNPPLSREHPSNSIRRYPESLADKSFDNTGRTSQNPNVRTIDSRS